MAHWSRVDVFLGMHYRVSWRWRRLANVYGSKQPIHAHSIRRMQSVILFGGAAFQSYKGVVNVAVSDEGIALSIMPPFHLFYFCRPLFIPHEDITSLPTEWYLNSVSYKWTVRRDPSIEIVIDHDLANVDRRGRQRTTRSANRSTDLGRQLRTVSHRRRRGLSSNSATTQAIPRSAKQGRQVRPTSVQRLIRVPSKLPYARPSRCGAPSAIGCVT